MISIREVDKKFHNGDVHALNNISVEVPEGEFIVLVGSNGSGKSTLLNVIAGSIIPDSGKIFIDKNDVTVLPDYKRSRWISRVFQNPMAGTAAELTVAENFRLASIRTSAKTFVTGITPAFKKSLKEKVATLSLGLENKLDQPMGSLSGGQRQALTLLMAVMDETKLLLMDEPVSALDPATAALVMKIADGLIREHKLTCVMVTHSLRDAHQFGDRIIQLAEGKVVNDIKGKEKASLGPEQLYTWF